jgi:hypothetical protein
LVWDGAVEMFAGCFPLPLAVGGGKVPDVFRSGVSCLKYVDGRLVDTVKGGQGVGVGCLDGEWVCRSGLGRGVLDWGRLRNKGL